MNGKEKVYGHLNHKESFQNGSSQLTKYFNPMIDGVKWAEKYSDQLESFFEKLPNFLGKLIATFAIFTFGATLKGEWVIILVTATKQLLGESESNNTIRNDNGSFTLENLKMNQYWQFLIWAHVVSYSFYFLIGGFIHWYFYVQRRHIAHEWKCQPDKWLSPELERHEIIVGSTSLFFAGTFSATLACYIYNGNPSTIYYKFDEYGWTWFFLQFVVVFIYQDYITYLLHRLYHTPWLYKRFHKLHHTYKQPTAFSVTAIHPVEILHMSMTMVCPLFIVPLHWLPFYSVIVYNYYHGIIDHSGVNFKGQWWQPWQPDAKFHDLHHELFHVNFGFNMDLWDRIHGTMRKENRIYNEEIFHGMVVEDENLSKTEIKSDSLEKAPNGKIHNE